MWWLLVGTALGCEAVVDRSQFVGAVDAAWKAGEGDPEPVTHARVKALLKHADEQRAKIAAERDGLYAPLVQAYSKRLKELETWLARKGRVEDGLAAGSEARVR